MDEKEKRKTWDKLAIIKAAKAVRGR